LKIAIFGGTFDPIHCAHLTVAREAVSRLRLDLVLFVPAANPPHKPGAVHADFEDRYRMVALACNGEPQFEASRLEAGSAPSYSIRTIERVKATQQPGDQLFFIIGTDAFAEIRTWRLWEDVINAVEFIVVTRPGHGYAIPEGARVHRLDTLALDVSSSAIRRRLAAGEQPPELPGPVLAYIREHRLYGAHR
jgi:nicotinate-nucleotide adenylyltransferase